MRVSKAEYKFNYFSSFLLGNNNLRLWGRRCSTNFIFFSLCNKLGVEGKRSIYQIKDKVICEENIPITKR